MTKFDNARLERDWADLMIRLGQSAEFHQLRKHLIGEADDLRATNLAKDMGRRFYQEVLEGVIKP